jgi:hypothetical protein
MFKHLVILAIFVGGHAARLTQRAYWKGRPHPGMQLRHGYEIEPPRPRDELPHPCEACRFYVEENNVAKCVLYPVATITAVSKPFPTIMMDYSPCRKVRNDAKLCGPEGHDFEPR